MRRRALWFLTLPALLVAETACHQLVAGVFDGGNARHRVLAHAVADYFELAVVALAVVGLLAAATLGRRALGSFRAEGPQPLPSWWLAVLPAIAFLAQENIEHLLQDQRLAWTTGLEPAVLIGIALELPCGLLAIWLVRTLLRAAEQLGWALARRAARPARPEHRVRLRPPAFAPLRLPVLASRQAGRAPPVVV
jgi:hypothetical protein